MTTASDELIDLRLRRQKLGPFHLNFDKIIIQPLIFGKRQ